MKKLIWIFAVVAAVLIAMMLGERWAMGGGFGLQARVALAGLAGFMLLSIWAAVTYRPAGRNLPAKIWIFIVVLAVTFVVLDLTAAAVLDRQLSPTSVRDGIVHHRLVPDTVSQIQGREFDYLQRVNNLGLRGADVSERKPESLTLILMLGDSFTMGMGVEDHQTFSVQLQELLNRSGEGRRFEVINAGIDSYSPILSYLQLSTRLHTLNPDLVILNLDMSDLVQEEVYRGQAVFGPDGEIVAVDGRKGGSGQPVASRFKDWLFRHTDLTRWALLFLSKSGADDRPLTPEDVVVLRNPALLEHTLEGDTQDRETQWELLFDSISRMKRYCDEREIEFLLTVYPWGHQVSDDEWRSGRKLMLPTGARSSDRSLHTIETLAGQRGIRLLNLFPALRAADTTEPLYHDFDMHWTEAGHRVVAETIAKERGRFPK